MPWNSIKIKLRLSHDASVRLRELAQQRNSELADLGILTVNYDQTNERFAIVDPPPSDTVNNTHGPSSSLGNPSSEYFTHLANDSQHSTDFKPVAGVRRTLAHSDFGSVNNSEYSSSPKIAKRASGLYFLCGNCRLFICIV